MTDYQHDEPRTADVEALAGFSEPTGAAPVIELIGAESDPQHSEPAAIDSEQPDAALLALGRQLETAWAAERTAVTTEGMVLAEALEQTDEMVERIIGIPAMSLPGLNVKLRALQWAQSGFDREGLPVQDGTIENRLIGGLIADGARLSAGTHHLPPADLDAPLVKLWSDFRDLASMIQEILASETATPSLRETCNSEMSDRLNSLGDQIRDTPALSLKGIGIKASWMLHHFSGGEDDTRAILEQVEAFARRHSHTRHTANIPTLEKDLGLPAADWELYRTFVNWLQSAIDLEALDDEMAGETDPERCIQLQAEIDQADARSWAFRKALVDRPATSLEGVRLKAHVYEWLTRDDNGAETNVNDHRDGGKKANDYTFAFAMARDLARMAPAQSLSKLAGQVKPGFEPADGRHEPTVTQCAAA